MVKIIERQGNIELLRILCMFFVMFAHFNLNAILRNDETSQGLNYFALLVNSLLFVCVNTYILISGYFSIKLKVKSILSLLIQTEFYAVLAICIFALFSISSCSNFTIGKHILVGMIPFRPYGLWFIPCYALLLIISPLLNRICEGKKTHALSIAVIGLGGLILYLTKGYLGNSVVNFILIYLIGRWIALYVKKNNKRQKYIAVFLLLLSVGLTFCLELWWLQRGNSVADKMIFSHSTPWIIASSVALFVLFKNITISKSWLFYIGPSVLSVYLFHENGLIKQYIYIKPLRYLFSISPNDALSYMIMIIYGLSLFSIIVLFDHYVRIPIQDYIMGTLKNNRVYKVMDSKLQKLNK
jgi:surface polysaccharide O-acyltransferase-like enzyme